MPAIATNRPQKPGAPTNTRRDATDEVPITPEISEAGAGSIDLELEGEPPVGAEENDREARIRAAAYAAFLRRGGAPGDEVQDWLDAEREVDMQDPQHQPPA